MACLPSQILMVKPKQAVGLGKNNPTRTIMVVSRYRVSPRTFTRLALAALLAQIFIIITGASVRLTGSGLGCSDWPKCEENQLIAPLEYHAMIEFLNRLVTGFVSLTVIAVLVGAYLRTRRRSDLTWLSWGLVGGVIGQIFLGGLTVIFHLNPPLVIAHFLLSMLLVWDAFVLWERSKTDSSPSFSVVTKNVRTVGRIVFVLSTLVIFSGTIVTGAGPHGGDETVKRLQFNLEDVTRVHSVLVWTMLLFTVITMVLLRRNGGPPVVQQRLTLLIAAIVFQGAIGYWQFFTDVPPWLVIIHICGAIAVWTAVLALNLSFTARPAEAEQQTELIRQ